MNTTKCADWSGCPIRYAMGIFGDKWSLLIIRDLMFEGRRRYGEFLGAGEGIATNILASRLAKLEGNGIIAKQPGPAGGSRNIYSLTEKGYDLLPVMLAMVDWSQTWDANTEVPKAFIKNFRKNPEGVKAKILADLRKTTDLGA